MATNDRTVPYIQRVQDYIFPGGFSTDAIKSAIEYVPREDDFFIVTYPKCGTTWAQQIVYLIYNEGKPVVNTKDFFSRTPFLEMFGKESGEQMPRPGAIKLHLPFHLTPYSEKAKYLYVVRNPKDVAVSYYHHMISDPLYQFQEGTFKDFFEYYISGNLPFGDYFQHVLGWYEHRNDPNVMFLTYEDLKRDAKKSVLKIAGFMGDEWLNLLTDDSTLLDNVLKYSHFDYMQTIFNTISMDTETGTSDTELYPGLKHIIEFQKKNAREGDGSLKLAREGKYGGWKTVLTDDQVARLDERIEKELKGTDLYKNWKSIGCM